MEELTYFILRFTPGGKKNMTLLFLKGDLINRFVQEDEEMLILTHSDELNRTYNEDHTLPFKPNTPRGNTRCDGASRNKSTLTEQNDPCTNERAAPRRLKSTSASRQDSTVFKETRATVKTSGPSTITITSAVSAADSIWFRNTEGCGKRFSEMGANSEKHPSFSEDQSKKKISCHQAGLLGDNMQTQRHVEGEGEKSGREESEEGTPEGERMRMTSANPVQNLSTGTAGRNPPATITAWEAGWNVTNAIQVRNIPNVLKRENNSH